MKKTFFSILVLGIIVLMTLIAFDEPPQAILVNNSEPKGASAPKTNNLQPSQKLTSEEAQQISSSLGTPQGNNLTQGLAYNIFKGILDESVSGEPVTEASLLNQILSAPVGFSVEDFVVEVETNRIITLSSPSDTDYEKYYSDLTTFIDQYISATDIDTNQFSSLRFKSIIEDFDVMIDSLYRMRVPINLTTFHQKQLRSLLTQQRVFESLATFENDPLKALAAIQVFEEASLETKTIWDTLISQ